MPSESTTQGYLPDAGQQNQISPPSPQPIASAERPSALNTQAYEDQAQFDAIAKGKASEVNDFDLTMAGIYAGDPVGMETFDLGFYGDGTPAIVINGAPVPIQMEQWAGLAEMRTKTRQHVAETMRFNAAKSKAQTAITKVTRAIPNLPAGLAELLMASSEINPDYAITQLSNLLLNNKMDGNRRQIGELSSGMLDASISNTMGSLSKSSGTELVENPNNKFADPQKVPAPSPIQKALRDLDASPSPSSNATKYAIVDLGNMFPSPQYSMATAGGRQSAFMRMANEGNDTAAGGSFFAKLQNLAAYSKLFPDVIPVVNVPTDITDPSDPRIGQLREYLRSLDMYAVRYLHYTPSNDQELNMQLAALLGLRRTNEQGHDITLPTYNPALQSSGRKSGANAPQQNAQPAPAPVSEADAMGGDV